ncbi:MAG: aminotransferase class I/II-fold pyridoxal phosphate-dependent enzyme [Pirellulales bacterium]|nr:aminotransferase class I/II-fold pyridoxal phosphate-dependent enzyme [Pirellulales bacterium]
MATVTIHETMGLEGKLTNPVRDQFTPSRRFSSDTWRTTSTRRVPTPPVQKPVAPQPQPQLEVNAETSLIDMMRARDNGVDLKTVAAFFRAALEEYERTGHNLYRRSLLGPSDAEALVHYPRETEEREMVILASNNYLGLTSHPRVIAAAQEAAAKYGTGSGSSPLLVGTFPVTRELEAKLAKLKGAEEACVFATGYQANVGVISAVASGPNDVVILDRYAHASMVDGAKLSGAQVKVFKHNDAEHLDRVLERNRDARLKLVCVEGIYSMDGDIAPLDNIHAVCQKHNALLLVDEAHSTGVLGENGAGAASQFGLEGKIDLHIGTLSKAIGACGGFVAGSADLVTYIRYFARSAMFSTAPSPMVMAAASAAIDVLHDEPERQARLWENCRFLHAELKKLGFTVNDEPSPVIPVIVGTMAGLRQMTLDLHRDNVCVNSVPFPVVPHGSERIRISLTANHTREQLVRALEALAKAGRAAGVIE